MRWTGRARYRIISDFHNAYPGESRGGGPAEARRPWEPGINRIALAIPARNSIFGKKGKSRAAPSRAEPRRAAGWIRSGRDSRGESSRSVNRRETGKGAPVSSMQLYSRSRTTFRELHIDFQRLPQSPSASSPTNPHSICRWKPLILMLMLMPDTSTWILD